MTFLDALEGYWLAKRRDFSPATVADYSGTFAKFHIWLLDHGNPPFAAITHTHIRAFLDHIAPDLAPKTIANHWVALSSLWTWAAADLGIPHVIRGRVQRPRYSRNQPEPYTETEIRQLLAAVDYTDTWRTQPGVRTRRATANRDRALLLVLLDTGLRASELCALKLSDYDRKTGRLAVRHGKGDKGRNVYLGYTARSALWRYIQDRQAQRRATSGAAALAPVEPLFAVNSGQHLTRSNLLHLIQRAAHRANVPNANVHRFRHTFAVNALRNGMNIYALQELLGHADLETVRMYLKLVEHDLRAAVAAASPADAWRL